MLSFVPRHDGRERLFTGSGAGVDVSQRIHGGIPLCWPWFGTHPEDPAQPGHGYISTRRWQLLDHQDDDAHTRLWLAPVDCTGPGFEGRATLHLEVLVGRTLTLRLHTTNTGTQPFRLTAALHSYFSVDDVRRCTLEGLQGDYLDNNRGLVRLPTPTPYRIEGETDRIHLCTPERVMLIDGDSRTEIGSAGHDSIVVWTPWSRQGACLPGLAVDDWQRMLCVETALTRGADLLPGATRCLGQCIG